MPLHEIYYIAEMVVGVAVIISIVFVAIELRQNTRIMKRDMAADRKQRMNWLLETGCTDSDFRAFHRKVDTEFDNLDDDEKWRANLFGARVVKSLLDELLDYLDGNITSDEWTAKDITILRAYEWDRINFATPEKRKRMVELWGMSEDELFDIRKKTRDAVTLDSAGENLLIN